MKTKITMILALGLLSVNAFAAVGAGIVLQGSVGSEAEKIYAQLSDGAMGPAKRTGAQVECTVIHALVPAGQDATPFYTCRFFVHQGGNITLNPGL